MKDGSLFLMDEISLADDSVLERLNSVLEPERKLVACLLFWNLVSVMHPRSFCCMRHQILIAANFMKICHSIN